MNLSHCAGLVYLFIGNYRAEIIINCAGGMNKNVYLIILKNFGNCILIGRCSLNEGIVKLTLIINSLFSVNGNDLKTLFEKSGADMLDQ